MCQIRFTNKLAAKRFNYIALSHPVIGVITPYGIDFKRWKRDVGFRLYGNDAKFRMLNTLDSIRGREFYTIELGYKHYEVDSNVYEKALLRII